MSTEAIPEGYMKNAAGNLVAIDNIKPLDLIENDLVKEMIEEALALQEQMIRFKTRCIERMEAFADLAASEYGAKRMGAQGNLTVKTYDGQYGVSIKVQKRMGFDAKLDVAKSLVDECIHEWAEDARPELKTLIESAFQVDKRGNINREKLFELLRLDIKDEHWLKAMDALRDSIYHESSKAYFVINRRISAKENKMVQLPMNLSSL